MTPIHHQVHQALESFDLEAPYPPEPIQALADGIQTFVLVSAIDLATMLAKLEMLDGVAPLVRSRHKTGAPLLPIRQGLAAQVTNYWQAFSDVCQVFLEHSAEEVVAAVMAPIGERVADFQHRWPTVAPDASYAEQRETMTALWYHCTGLKPSRMNQMH